MNIGDLVKNRATWHNGIGIVMYSNTGGWWILWDCGTRGFHNESDLEVINENR